MSENYSLQDKNLVPQDGDPPAASTSGPALLTSHQRKANVMAIIAIVLSIIAFFFPPYPDPLLCLLPAIMGYLLAKKADRNNGKYAKDAIILNKIAFWANIAADLLFFIMVSHVG